jgi:adenylate cyclase class IV
VREVELKGVVADARAARARLEAAGATLVFAGRLEDRRYDTTAGDLARRDHVLRVRVYHEADGARAALDWKGPTTFEGGYKVREELSTGVDDAHALLLVLQRLGYSLTREIDRDVAQYEHAGATLRFEHYPRMDVLLEVEGGPDAIDRGIAAAGLDRDEFTAERLVDFVRRYERRTGERAALSRRELAGDYRFRDAGG